MHELYFFSTHKIVGISTISRAEHSVPQTREVACTKEVLPQVISRGCFTNVFFLTVTLYVSRFADYRGCP